MTKIKVFEVMNGDDECAKEGLCVSDVLEKRVNLWLSEQDITILHVLQSTDASPGFASSTRFYITLTIVYKESSS